MRAKGGATRTASRACAACSGEVDDVGEDVDPRGVCLVMTHDHALDQEAIEWALEARLRVRRRRGEPREGRAHEAAARGEGLLRGGPRARADAARRRHRRAAAGRDRGVDRGRDGRVAEEAASALVTTLAVARCGRYGGGMSATIPFDAKHPHALAMYCSDGRFTEAVEGLLRDLGHARLDTLTIPGGPALLDLTSSGLGAVDVMRDAATFLIRGHAIKQVVLLGHEGCGYYKARYKYESTEAMRRRQLSDPPTGRTLGPGRARGARGRHVFRDARGEPRSIRRGLRRGQRGGIELVRRAYSLDHGRSSCARGCCFVAPVLVPRRAGRRRRRCSRREQGRGLRRTRGPRRMQRSPRGVALHGWRRAPSRR